MLKNVIEIQVFMVMGHDTFEVNHPITSHMCREPWPIDEGNITFFCNNYTIFVLLYLYFIPIKIEQYYFSTYNN
jgi:hypothetical protein